MRLKLLSAFILIFYKILQWTWRIRIEESHTLKDYLKNKKTFVIAHWHGDEYSILHLLPRYRVACMVSNSKDGEIVNNIIHYMGCKTSRGSSTRGAVSALKGILRLARQGWRPSVAVDGPKGPIYRVKPGVIEIAKVTKAPIFPISVRSSNPFIFKKAWNKGEIPKPFSKVQVYWGDPLYIDKTTDHKEAQEKLAAQLHHSKQQATLLLNK